MNQEIINKAGEIIKGNPGDIMHCALGLIDLDGYPTVSTISIAKSDGIKWLAFGTSLDIPKIKRIEKCNKASVCVNSKEYNITLVGTVKVITDPEIKNEMWYDGLTGFFNGYDDPNYCVLMFETGRYNITLYKLLDDWVVEEAKGTL